MFEAASARWFGSANPGWASAPLAQLTTKIGSGATPRGGEQSYKREGVALIRSLNVHDDGFRYTDLARIDNDQASKLEHVTLERADVLLNITGASIARCCNVPAHVLPARVNQHVTIIRPMPSRLDSCFLHYLLTSRPYKGRLLGVGESGGSTRQALTKADIQTLMITFPPAIDQQVAIVRQLRVIESSCVRLAQIAHSRLGALDSLKWSLLHHAFTGQLTARVADEALATA